MHELGIADAMMKTIQNIVEEEGAGAPSSVTVEIGELSGVVPRFLEDAWTAVIDGTPFSGVELRIREVPGTVRCMDCESEFRIDLENMRCPSCGGAKLIPLTGRDLTIAEIEISEEA